MHLNLISVKLRREIFRALVEVQDSGESVAKSRDTISKRYELTRKQLRAIEDEGVEREWPPLSQGVEEALEPDNADTPIVVPAPNQSENHAA
jgi:hypothetical protein